MAAEALKTQAEQLFAELKAANERTDLARVNEILDTPERGDTFVSRSEIVTEKAMLKHERTRLQVPEANLQTTVQTLQQSETYLIISLLSDWDVYSAETRHQLTEQLRSIEAV